MNITRNYLINILQQHGIIKTNMTLNPVFNRRLLTNPVLAQHILNATIFLRGDPDYKVRLHVLLLGLSEQPTCKVCGNDVYMRVTGRQRFTFPDYCSMKCIGESLDTKNKRIATNIERYGAAAYIISDDYSKVKSVPASNILL